MRRAILLSAAVLVATACAATWAFAGGAGPGATASAAPATTPPLANTLADARLATAKYANDLDAAKADGYRVITPIVPDMGVHFMNPAVTGFDPTKPPILVYEKRGSQWTLGALEWVFPSRPKTAPWPGARYGSFPAACHYADGNFIPTNDQADCAAKDPDTGAAFTFWHPKLVTLHVWLWYANPTGLYASMNPLVRPFNGGETAVLPAAARGRRRRDAFSCTRSARRWRLTAILRRSFAVAESRRASPGGSGGPTCWGESVRFEP